MKIDSIAIRSLNHSFGIHVIATFNLKTIASVRRKTNEATERSTSVFSSIVSRNAHFKRRVSAPVLRLRKLALTSRSLSLSLSFLSCSHIHTCEQSLAPPYKHTGPGARQDETLLLALNLLWKERHYTDVYIVTLSRPFFMMISGTRFTCPPGRKRAHTSPDHIVTTDTYGSMHASNKLPIPADRGKKRERERSDSPFIRFWHFQPKEGARVYTVTVKPFYRGVFFLRLHQPPPPSPPPPSPC